MDQSTNSNNNYSPPFIKKIKERVYRWIRLTSRPVVKVYTGYGNEEELVVFGHVLSLSPLPRKKYRRNIWTNTLALIRLFMVQPLQLINVDLHFNGETIAGTTEKDGFFRFQWKPAVMPAPGWHKVEVLLVKGAVKNYYGPVKGEGEIFVPHSGQYAIISDIDDTFLISYSSNLRKRLYVLLTENAYSRKPFEGVVRHYQSLELAGEKTIHPNPFFYVSSSEWNLYDYIRDFSRKNILPKGVYLLSQMKSFTQIWKTGQNNHATKFVRISRIMQAFPERKFILLGDDSQQDPVIYASVAEHFPAQVKAVYLRNVFQKNKLVVQASIQKMEAAGIAVCHFQHSRDAIAHSREIGLILL
ncbi:MAG: DUF2183 domain-containing protein [Chitinophagaceae bacterium]|nr:DUF2183 domain-containing protein [Chitinophagaceae bacterium]